MTTVSNLNFKELPEIIDIVVKNGADVFSFARYCPTSNGKENSITPIQYRELLKICDEKFKAYEAAGCETWFDKKDHLWTLYKYETGEFKIPDDALTGMIYAGCNCGNSHLTILPDGEIFACRRVFNSKVGNAFNDDLKEIWLNTMENYRDYKKFAKCSKCELLAWCLWLPDGNSAYLQLFENHKRHLLHCYS